MTKVKISPLPGESPEQLFVRLLRCFAGLRGKAKVDRACAMFKFDLETKGRDRLCADLGAAMIAFLEEEGCWARLQAVHETLRRRVPAKGKYNPGNANTLAPERLRALRTAVQTERSAEEIREWLEDAGFVKAGLVPAPGPSPLIFADKP